MVELRRTSSRTLLLTRDFWFSCCGLGWNTSAKVARSGLAGLLLFSLQARIEYLLWIKDITSRNKATVSSSLRLISIISASFVIEVSGAWKSSGRDELTATE